MKLGHPWELNNTANKERKEKQCLVFNYTISA